MGIGRSVVSLEFGTGVMGMEEAGGKAPPSDPHVWGRSGSINLLVVFKRSDIPVFMQALINGIHSPVICY